MPEEHAKLSASGSSRWINCPGSIVLESSFGEKESEYAEEGRLAHSVAELKLTKYFKKGIGPKKFKSAMDEFKKSPYWNKSMDDYTDDYFEFVKEKALSYPDRPFVDVELRVDYSNVAPEGFGTCDCVMIHGNELSIIDLKYGTGVKVAAKDNSQLMLYALGVYNMFSVIYDIKTVSMTIVQPRLNHFDTHTISIEELLAFSERVKPIAQEAYTGSDRLAVGDHCKFCKAKSKCRARAESMFKPVKENVLPVIDKKPGELLTSQEIGELLIKLDGVVDWIKSLEAEGLAEALAGNEVTGFKLVEGRSVRKITDESGAVSKLVAAGFEESLLYERRLLSMTKIEAIVGKKDFATILGGVIEKPPGKPTLVKASDKRKEYDLNDAKSMFNNVNEEKENN
ncbi:putative uncharacterized protein [Peptostreptococcus anaerobius CAG:621]|jgi:hypothetical protein|uniref:DUF2800 domain-containing protein n=1 Tax=Peptostreptococcus anaerobius TaxID=1261 RepID=UPI0003382CF7|nr:DUF2800 domain-containing protein [Peptostreptococcus anaerobius]CCY48557.1 putative uncharacterized protein [Peptostreptococcus anaerobius CAG:621]